MPPLRGPADTAMLKSAGPAYDQTRLHQEPGHLSPLASNGDDATADTVARIVLPMWLGGDVSEGKDLYNAEDGIMPSGKGVSRAFDRQREASGSYGG